MKTYIDTGVVSGPINLIDEVAPRVKYNTDYLYTSSSSIELPYTEELESAGTSLYGRDLEVTRISDGQPLKEGTDYTTSLDNDKSILRITIKTGNMNSGYSVRLLENSNGEANYIRDAQGNMATTYGEYFTTR